MDEPPPSPHRDEPSPALRRKLNDLAGNFAESISHGDNESVVDGPYEDTSGTSANTHNRSSFRASTSKRSSQSDERPSSFAINIDVASEADGKSDVFQRYADVDVDANTDTDDGPIAISNAPAIDAVSQEDTADDWGMSSKQMSAKNLSPTKSKQQTAVDPTIGTSSGKYPQDRVPTSSKSIKYRSSNGNIYDDKGSIRDSEKYSSRKSQHTRPSSVSSKVKSSVYFRLIGNRRLKSPVGEDPKKSGGTVFGSLKDRFSAFAGGSSVDERKTLRRLEWYKRSLEFEKVIMGHAQQDFTEHSRSNISQFEAQEQKLQAMGLHHALRPFRMQAWARVSRSALIEDLTVVARGVLKARLERAAKVLLQFQDPEFRKAENHQIDAYDKFCLGVEDIMAKDPTFSALANRLLRMDRICNSTMNAFQPVLHDLESSTHSNRKDKLIDILQRYNVILQESEPAGLESILSWEEFCIWFAKRREDMKKLELAYASIVEDERNREGRLFKRWCNMVIENTSRRAQAHASLEASMSEKVPTKSEGSDTFDGQDNGNGKKPHNPNAHEGGSGQPPAPVLPPSGSVSPKSIKAFVSYFAVNVVCANYEIPQEFTDSATILTQYLIHRSIRPAVLRYENSKMQERDAIWRKKCRLVKFADPIVLGVPEEFVYGFKKKKLSDDEAAACIADIAKKEQDKAKLESERSSSVETIDDFFVNFTPTMHFKDMHNARKANEEKMQRNAKLYGTPYGHSSHVLSWFTGAVVPHEFCSILLLAQKWLLKDAVAVSGKFDYIGADVMFPITVLALADANIPNIHEILRFLQQYGHFDQQSGEISYYMTCLQASVEFILQLEIPQSCVDEYNLGDIAVADDTLQQEVADANANHGADSATKVPLEGDGSIEKLGEWLRDQESMEDTISILQKEGWML